MSLPDPNDLISEWVREEAAEHEARRPEVLYVTDLVYCPARRVFELKYPEIVTGEMFSQHATHGSVVHSGLQALLKEKYESLGYSAEVEVECEKVFAGYLVKGRADLVVRGDGGTCVIEIKNPRARGPSWPNEPHVEQLRIYMNMLGASHGVLLYFTHDARASYAVDGAMSDEDVAKRVEETVSLSQCPRWQWECKGYCPFAQLCSRARV